MNSLRRPTTHTHTHTHITYTHSDEDDPIVVDSRCSQLAALDASGDLLSQPILQAKGGFVDDVYESDRGMSESSRFANGAPTAPAKKGAQRPAEETSLIAKTANKKAKSHVKAEAARGKPTHTPVRMATGISGATWCWSALACTHWRTSEM